LLVGVCFNSVQLISLVLVCSSDFIMESKDSAQPPNYFLSPDMLSITSIRLNGSNYAQWAQAVEIFLLGRKKFDYVIKEPPIPTDPKSADWRAEDA